MLQYGCGEVLISHRIAWGYAICLSSAGSGGGGGLYAQHDHEQWWVAANGTLLGLAWLLLFCGSLAVAVRIGPARLREALGDDAVAECYDFGTFWALVWYPVVSLLARWGDFVTIYGGELPLVALFLSIQLLFLSMHSAVRKRLGLCSGGSGGGRCFTCGDDRVHVVSIGGTAGETPPPQQQQQQQPHPPRTANA
jgi:hypothetical protein